MKMYSGKLLLDLGVKATTLRRVTRQSPKQMPATALVCSLCRKIASSSAQVMLATPLGWA